MIEVKDVTFSYPRASSPVLQNVSEVFRPGEAVALTGKNGCGKTTLTKLLVGILRPASGSVFIDGEDISGKNLFEIGLHVGYVFQNPSKQLFCPTVYDEISFGPKNRGLSDESVKLITEEYMDFFRLTGHRDDYPGNLSRGEMQRTALASVLSLGTGYLVLDEPTTGLDMRGRHELGGLLTKLKTERNCGIIFVSHERDFIEKYADRQVVIGG